MLPKRLIKSALAKAGYSAFRTEGHYLQDGLFTVHNSHFQTDPAFRAAYNRGIQASNGVDPQFEWRLHVALWAASHAFRSADGDFVECGVNAGFISSAILHHLDWNSQSQRKFFLIDTFAGPVLSQFSANEIQHGRRAIAERAIVDGAYVTDLDRVRANYAEWPMAHVVAGVVPDVLESVDIQQVAFLHIDMNCAYPEEAALRHFWNKLSKGAAVLLDDYAYYGHEQQASAMDQCAKDLGANILSLPTGQGLILR